MEIKMIKKTVLIISIISLIFSFKINLKADSSTISICGFQYNKDLNGYRILYTTPQNVSESGIIFGASFAGAGDEDMVLNNDSDIIRTYRATDNALISYEDFISVGGNTSFPSTNEYCLFTVISNGDTKFELEASQAVRPYAILNNGTVVYGKIQHFSVYKIAYSLYYNCMSMTQEGHEFLYDNIIKVCNPDAPRREFDWSGVVNF